MKVLMINTRLGSRTAWGGDTTQLCQTQQALQALGVSADVLEDGERKNWASYDLVHLFNLQTAETGLDLLNRAKAANRPVALSTVWWDLSYARHADNLRFGQSSFWACFANAMPLTALGLHRLRYLRAFLRQRRAQARLLLTADLILPNSVAELEILVAQFGCPALRARAVIVPNGISEPAPSGPDLSGILDSLPSRYVLVVAGFHPIKGQARLLEALMDDRQLPLVFVGRMDGQQRYLAYCRRLASRRGNTFFVGERPHADMPLFYRRAKVHVLPSLRESPGLASLEAALYGANIVVGIHAPIQEYFSPGAFVCNPDDSSSLACAVRRAWDSPPSEQLRTTLLRKNTWARAAEETLRGYQWLLNRSGQVENPVLTHQRRLAVPAGQSAAETRTLAW